MCKCTPFLLARSKQTTVRFLDKSKAVIRFLDITKAAVHFRRSYSKWLCPHTNRTELAKVLWALSSLSSRLPKTGRALKSVRSHFSFYKHQRRCRRYLFSLSKRSASILFKSKHVTKLMVMYATEKANNCRLPVSLIKRQFFSMSRIFDKRCSKPKIFLAYHLNSLCFSFTL